MSPRLYGIVPTKRLSDRSRYVRFRQDEMVTGSEEFIELLEREIIEREGNRQTNIGKGPEREAPVRLTEITELRLSHTIPVQLHGVASRSDQLLREPAGSDSESLTLNRYKLS